MRLSFILALSLSTACAPVAPPAATSAGPAPSTSVATPPSSAAPLEPPAPSSSDAAPPVRGSRKIERVIASDLRGCALFEDGRAQCWGGHDIRGELGQRGRKAQGTPGWVQGLVGITDLALTDDATCALLRDGRVSCWGRGWELKERTREEAAIPRLVEGLPKAHAIALGRHHACAIDEADRLWCWGGNTRGELGLGDAAVSETALPPAVVPTLSEVAGVLAADGITVAWTKAGRLHLWGGSGVPAGAWHATSPRMVNGLVNVRRAFLSRDHVCALLADRQVRCFSHETLADFEQGRQLDLGPSLAPVLKRARALGRKAPKLGSLIVPDGRGVTDAVDLVVQNHDVSALTKKGEVFSWGNPERGTVGVAPPGPKGFLPPTRIDGVSGAVQLVGGFLHRCARDERGAVVCFGQGRAGLLGPPGASDAPRAVPVAGLPPVRHLAANDHCTFAVDAEGALWAWGRSWIHACGVGENDTALPGPTRVPLAADE